MIIYRDITTDNKDEIVSDTFKLIEAGDGLWEVDCKMITKGAENFVLEGANPSTEGEDADDGGDASGTDQRVLDIEDQFRLNKIEGKPSKKAFQGEIKKYCKKVLDKLKEIDPEKAKEFQASAQGAVKKILANYDNYDLYMGESMQEDSMFVLVDFREDGTTPYATIWKYGLEEYKV